MVRMHKTACFFSSYYKVKLTLETRDLEKMKEVEAFLQAQLPEGNCNLFYLSFFYRHACYQFGILKRFLHVAPKLLIDFNLNTV